MKNYKILFVSCIGMLCLCSCGMKDKEPVENISSTTKSFYSDTVKLNNSNKLNYNGYFLGEGISASSSLDICSDTFNSLVYSWNWDLLMQDYAGNKLNLEESEKQKLWGKNVSSKEAEAIEVTGVDSIKKEELIIETNGSVENISEIMGMDIVLIKGQVFQIVPVYVEPIKEVNVSESKIEETNENKDKKKLKTIKYIIVSNYSNNNMALKDCISNGWYMVVLDNYLNCFDIQQSDEEKIFERIAEKLGYPTCIWEKPICNIDYVNGKRNEIFAFEYPDYTITADIVEKSESIKIENMYYIPNSLWLGSKIYEGVKNTYSGSYVEVCRDEFHAIEDSLKEDIDKKSE